MDENTIIKNDTLDQGSPVGANMPTTSKKDFKKARMPFLWELTKIIVVAVLIVLPIRYFIFQPFIVKGDSMVPNFHSGDYVIVDEISYRFVAPSRGDVVVLKYPLDVTQKFIKRIIGLPGETVQIKNGKVNIIKDAKVITLDEQIYLPDLLATDGDTSITLESNQYFVMGDNRAGSFDSRRWGVLPKNDIIGRAIFRIFPVTNMSYIANPSY